MPDKPTTPLSSNLSINPPPPSSTSVVGFTPRSSSFPDNDMSDEDDFDPTPVHSPGGPHYDDLPPSYDEAQQQGLLDARNGIPPLNPERLDINRMTLGEYESLQYEIPRNAEVHAHRATANGLARENRRSVGGVDVDVPVQHVQRSESVPVGRVGNMTTTSSANQAEMLLNKALEFTKHEPDADTRYAPRLTRCIAIPQDTSPSGRKGKGKARRENWRERGRTRGDTYIPSAWPRASSENLPVFGENDNTDEPAQFLRAYAKALHAHSIRPAEFLDFLDGLNALCLATKCTLADLVRVDGISNDGVDIVRSYMNATNEAFFALRGLKVTIKTFASLLGTAKVPEERGQKAGAVASVLDSKSTPVKRARALHPWIEALEINVAEPSIAAVMLKEMSERFENAPAPSSLSTTAMNEHPQVMENEKTRLEREYAERERTMQDDENPPQSVPVEFSQVNDAPGQHFGNWRGHDFGGRGGRRTPFGALGHGPFGPRGHGPHGPQGFTPFGPPGHGPHGPPGFGPFGPPGCGPWGSQHRGGPHTSGKGWDSLGQSIGKWGEEFGKKMEAWGDQFAKDAAEWGNDFSRRADSLGQRASGGGHPSGYGTGAAGPSMQRAYHTSPPSSSAPDTSTIPPEAQETGVYRSSPGDDHIATELQNHADNKADKKHNRDDASSISDSSSDSDSNSDSDDEDYEKEYTKASNAFNTRIHEINIQADACRAKGKKAPAEIERERAAAIEAAALAKSTAEETIAQERARRSVMRGFRAQKRELMREKKNSRRTLKKQGLGKKSREWKEIKRGFAERKKVLREEKNGIRRQFREARRVEKVERRAAEALEESKDQGIWIVVENLG